MSKAIKVFVIYILFLLACSLIFNGFNVSSDFQNFYGTIYRVRLILIPTIIGGIIALYYLIPLKTLRIFVIVYFSLWALRYLILFTAIRLGEVQLFGKTFHFDIIIANYYKTASRLETPLPFVIFWLIYYFYSKVGKSADQPQR